MKNWIYLLGITLGLSACVKDDAKTTWDTQLLTPIVKSELTVEDIIGESGIEANPDGSLKLVYEETMYEIGMDSLFQFPDTILEFGASLQSLELPNDTIEYAITLGEIARQQGGIFGVLLAANHGNSMPIPALTGLSSGNISINANDLFESIDLDSGYAEVIIENGLPTDIENVNYQISNNVAQNQDVIIAGSFPLISSNGSVTETVDLHGKTIFSELSVNLINLDLTGTGGNSVLIDTNAAVVAKIIIKNLKPNRATAIWPDQNLVDTVQTIMIPPSEGIQVKEMIVREGSVNLELFSSLQDSIYLTYAVPNLVKNGQYFIADTVLPPAPQGGFSSLTASFPFNGYTFKLTGFGTEQDLGYDFNGNGYFDNDTINTYFSVLQARIQYTGELVELSLEDTLFVHASVEGVIPEVVYGFMGNDTLSVGPDSVSYESFSHYLSGQIDLEEVDFTIEVENGIGADAKIDFNSLESINSNNNNTVALNTTNFNIAAAIDGGTYFDIQTSSLLFDEQNSNIDDFIENFPNQFKYDLDLIVNPGYTPSSLAEILGPPTPNFAYYNSKMTAKLKLELPLSFVADSLVLGDTLDFSLNTSGNSRVEEGTFKLLVNNGFPFDATTTLYFMDENYNIIDSLWTDQTVQRGIVNATTLRVEEHTLSEIEFYIDAEKMDRIKTASFVYVLAGFHTFDLNNPSAQAYKIYSDYSFDVKLIGDFKYGVSQ